MNPKTNSSILTVVKDTFVALRKRWGIKNRYSMTEIAQKAGLPVEYLKSAPKIFDGFLDCHDEPRFIAVNRELPPHQQAFFIARQVAFRAHQQRYNSLALDLPWKWEMLDAAPADLKEKISQLDIEDRAHWFMLVFTTGDEFRAFIKESPKRFWSHAFTTNVVWYHLAVFRAELWFTEIRRRIASVVFPVS